MKIQVVIVLYQSALEDSESYKTVLASLSKSDHVNVSIMIWDNSPSPKPLTLPLPVFVTFCQHCKNVGLPYAYNMGLKMANENGARWLLLLDQDTSVNADYFARLKEIESRSLSEDIVAIVPTIVMGQRTLSPYRFHWGARPIMPYFGDFEAGVGIYAFNSGTLVCCNFLTQIGGYPTRFWLDQSDHLFFNKIAQAGKRVLVLGDCRFQHSLSQLSGELSPQRAIQTLEAASAFWDEYMGRAAGYVYTLMLLRQLLGQVRRRESNTAIMPTFQSFIDRVRHTRKTRLKRRADSML